MAFTACILLGSWPGDYHYIPRWIPCGNNKGFVIQKGHSNGKAKQRFNFFYKYFLTYASLFSKYAHHKFWLPNNIKQNKSVVLTLPWTPVSNREWISLDNINIISSKLVMRIKKNINHGAISWSNTKFSKTNIIRIVRQAVRSITYEILRGLKSQNSPPSIGLIAGIIPNWMIKWYNFTRIYHDFVSTTQQITQ